MAADGSKGCKGVVSQAIGREISDDEFARVAGDIDQTLRMLWKTERAKMATLSKADQHRYAASVAVNNLQAQAALKQRRLALSIARNAENLAYLESRGMTFAAFNDITSFGASVAGGGPGRLSVESQARATAEMAKGELIDLVEAAGGTFFGLIENGVQVRAFVNELFGKPSGDPAMAKAAASWRKVTDGLRERFNRAGGDIGNLGDLWHLPQTHDAWRIGKAGPDAWVEAVLPKLDRRQYVNADGALMSDVEVREFLREAFRSIRTDGANKINLVDKKPAMRGTGMRANRHGEARALFFKDGDAYMDYQLQFGGQNIYAVMFNHIDTLAKDIALVETFGPNAEANARLLMDTIFVKRSQAFGDLEPVKADGGLRGALSGAWSTVKGNVDDAEALRSQAWRANAIFEDVAGIGQGPASAGFAGRMAAARSWMTATRLGSAVISSITDHATIIQTARMWNLPVMQFYRNYWKTLNPANMQEKRDLQRMGLAINAFASSMDRFSGEYGGVTSHKVANAVMRASGLTAITDARRRAFSAMMMTTLGDMVMSKAWGDLDANDLRLLNAKGVTPETYAIWQKAKQETTPDYPGGLLSGRSIMAIDDPNVSRDAKEKAATQLMGLILEEQNMAIIEAGSRERALLYAGTKKGTIGGELMRAVMQFKTFPFAMLTRHWGRALSAPTGRGRAVQMASLFAMSTITGALALELKALIDGKDPRALWESDDPERTAKTWAAAAMQGGALGIFGDFLTSTVSRGGSDFMSTLAGPLFGLVGDVGNLTIGNMQRAALGEETDVMADSVRIAKGLTPGASLWYGKAAFNNLVFGQLQEMASPGYLDRMRRRVARETGQDYWWTPGEFVPERAPDLGAVAE